MNRTDDYATPLAHLPTLDERWLAFVTRTAGIFSVYPEAIPLRQTFFKLFVEQQSTLPFTERIKHWAKAVLKRQSSAGVLSPVDVVFWLDNSREVQVDTILPVYWTMQSLGIRAQLVVTPRVATHLGNTFSPVRFQAPYHHPEAHRWRRVWDDFASTLPDDLAPRSWPAFLVQATVADSLAREMERILGRLRPKVLILPVDQLLPGATACTTARRMGIPSLVLLHGAVIPYNAPLTADKMAVWGDVSKTQLAALGVPEDDLIVLGSPRHDQFPVSNAQEARRRFQRTLNLGEGCYMVFFSNGNDVRRNSVEAVAGCAAWLDQAAQELSGQVEFVVRLHPNEDGRYYTPYPRLCVFKNECDLDTTLNAADVCGALCSTTLSDALLYKKTILQFYADGWPPLADNWQRDLAERIVGPQHLIEALRVQIEAETGLSSLIERQQSLVPTVFANHPYATNAVVQYISETYL